MPSLTDLRNAYRVQKEAKRVKKELKHIHVEAESMGVKVVVTGEQDAVNHFARPTAHLTGTRNARSNHTAFTASSCAWPIQRRE